MSLDNPQSAPGAGAASPQFGSSSPSSENNLSDTLAIVRKRRLLLITALLLGALYGLYKALTQVRLYESSGRIQIREGSSNEFKLTPTFTYDDDPQRKTSTEIAIITSDTLMATVGREMNLANNPAFLGVKGPLKKHQSMDDPEVRDEVVTTLQAGLKVAMVAKTDIIRLSYSSLDPKLSAEIVNHVINDYIQRSFETRYNSTKQVSHFLTGQLDELKQEVEASQDKVIDLQEKLGTLGFDSKNSQTTTALDDLARASGQAKLARILAESRYRMLNGMDPNSIESSIDSGAGAQVVALNTLRTSLASAKATYAELTATLGPNHPQVKTAKANVDALQHEVDAEQNRLLSQAKESYLIAKNNEEKTAGALETEKQDAYKLGGLQVQYTIALRQFEANRTLYDGLMQRLQTAKIESGLESLEIDVVDQALPALEPQLKSKMSQILLYSFLGLLLGGAIAFLLEILDTGLRTVAEIEAITELPSLAIVPRARRSTPEQLAAMTTVERNINVLTQPKSQFTEAFRSLRTALLLSATGKEPKLILFTSATPSEGKTTAASNLAVILAQRGTRTLLIDADLRRPNVHHRFGLNGKLGLSTILSGQTRLEDSIQNVAEVPSLDILASGPVPPFPTEMLGSASMKALLEHARTVYTHIVLDSPPILSVTDGVLLSRDVDAVVLVVRSGKSSKHVVRRARDLLVRSSAPLVGLVLNAVDLNSPEYYGYYGYSGYSYSSLDTAGWDAKGGESSKRRKRTAGEESDES